MGFEIRSGDLAERLRNSLRDAESQQADALLKLASGSRFTPGDPQPAARALSERMESKLRALSASKRNIADATSLLQTAEASLAEIANMLQRMKELHLSAASTTVSDQERRYLLVEYQAIHDEMDRISVSTEFNGIPLLHGENERTPEELLFRIGDSAIAESSEENIAASTVRLPDFRDINTRPAALGLASAQNLLDDYTATEGIELEEVLTMLEPEDDTAYATRYDEALDRLSAQRAQFGAFQTRLHHALDFVDVFHENIMASRSRLADTDYAAETARLVSAQIRATASTSLLSQTNAHMETVLSLLR